MAVSNGGFEDEGAAAWEADGWTSTFVSSLEEQADFALNPSDTDTSAQEDFERGWTDPDDQAFVGAYAGPPADLEAAEFDVGPGQQAVERFEPGWPATLPSFTPEYLPALLSTSPALFGSDQFEGFGAGWGDAPFELDAEAAEFGSEEVEDLEAGWQSNHLYAYSFSGESAVFGAGTTLSLPEAFEAVLERQQVTFDVSAEEVQFVQQAPPLADGGVVRFLNEGGGLPAGLAEDTDYYADNVDGPGGTFQVSAQATLLPLLVFSDAGTGDHFMVRDPSRFWHELMATT